MKKHWIRLVVCLAVAAVPATQAFALDWQKLLASEETFLAEMGDRAVFVAPGVYEVRERGGIKVRVAFGAGGREFDRAWVEADLLAGRALRDRSAQPSMQLEAHVRRLERLLENLQPAPESRAAVTTSWSPTVPGCAGKPTGATRLPAEGLVKPIPWRTCLVQVRRA